MTTEQIEKIIGRLHFDEDTLTERDKVYNRVARNQPAYISLLFPLIAAIIILYNKKLLDIQGGVVGYIFNSMTLLILFLPAIFFLYKQIIRVLSELVVEVLVFKCWNPNYAPYNPKICFSLSSDEITKIKEKLKDKYEAKLELESDDISKRNKEVKKAIKYIRDDKNVRDDNIVFENNCVYGFFRNLVGGIVLNLIICYVVKFWGLAPECITKYLYYSIRILWALLIVFTIMSWYTRFKHIKRESIIFFVKKTDNAPS